MSPGDRETYRRRTAATLAAAGVVLTAREREEMDIADLGLGQFEASGIAVVVYVNTARVCAKELVLLPGQTCPQHRHPPVDGEPGKEETFRCRTGEVYLYVPGEQTASPRAHPPAGRADTYTVFHEVILRPGEQYTILPDTWHWFQAGPHGAILSEFSTRSTDEHDIFVDRDIRRMTL